jgi:hypothetical protein
MKITKDQYQSYLSEGLPQDQYDELDQNAEISGPIYDELTMIDLDGVEIPGFHKLFKSKYDQSLKEYEKKYGKKLSSKAKKTKIEYAVVGERWVKRSWYTLEIFEEFDINKLSIELSRDVYFGRSEHVDTFSLNYAGREFEFKENFGANSDDYYLMKSNGERNNFDIIDSDNDNWDEDDLDQDDVNDDELSTLQILCDKSSTANKIAAELDGWEGVAIIVIKDGRKLTVNITGPKENLNSINEILSRKDYKLLGTYTKKFLS